MHARVGHIVAWTSDEPVLVDYPGNPGGPQPARSVVELSPDAITAAIRDGRGVLLSFEDGRPDAPIITGLLQPLPSPEVEVEPDQARIEGVDEALVDGRRVVLEAADEIVLRCGKATIVLRRNGRVVIRGTYVETRSKGVNRVKGGSVEIN
ncbi:hypothetical protein PPSIR1_13695 [Plesiocystis pacifica SIR-1]|uniref:DUF6484 domain-containing protein n=1 Tax=Plesiocystis pacifica SIR-1 TaxID=391625 RepID=A6GJJ7_9BACT|nr:hypothetical protein PPSIR1_13695 [Plesiocystis pacifica SIR-1]